MTEFVEIPIDLLEKLAPEEPMNQDEQGGCVWCGGSAKRSLYASSDPKDHYEDCPWVAARKLLPENRTKIPPFIQFSDWKKLTISEQDFMGALYSRYPETYEFNPFERIYFRNVVYRIRRKIGQNAIVTNYGVGYTFGGQHEFPSLCQQ